MRRPAPILRRGPAPASQRGRGARLAAWVALLLACALPLAAGAAPAQSCEELMREIKLAVFDEKWPQVQADTGRLLAEHPQCRHRQQATYVRAQALDRQGKGAEALAAYQGFLDGYCQGGSPALDCGLARSSLYDLAGREYARQKRPEMLLLLLDGLADPGDSGILAALTLADLPDATARARALPRLLSAYTSDVDPDVRNRICLAVLKIDPDRSPCSSGREARDEGGAPSLISVELFNKEENRVELRVNMPVALADAVIKALPPQVHQEMAKEGIDIQAIYQAIREHSRGTLFSAETDDMTIRIWLQ